MLRLETVKINLFCGRSNRIDVESELLIWLEMLNRCSQNALTVVIDSFTYTIKRGKNIILIINQTQSHSINPNPNIANRYHGVVGPSKVKLWTCIVGSKNCIQMLKKTKNGSKLRLVHYSSTFLPWHFLQCRGFEGYNWGVLNVLRH